MKKQRYKMSSSEFATLHKKSRAHANAIICSGNSIHEPQTDPENHVNEKAYAKIFKI
jgi:hypothetical protein